MTRRLVVVGATAAVLLLGGVGTWAMGDSEWGMEHCQQQVHVDADVDGWSWWPPGVRCRVDGRVEVIAPW